MTGIQFVTDEKGQKVAVQIDLKIHGALLVNDTGYSAQFNLDSDRAYAYLTWDWDRRGPDDQDSTNTGILNLRYAMPLVPPQGSNDPNVKSWNWTQEGRHSGCTRLIHLCCLHRRRPNDAQTSLNYERGVLQIDRHAWPCTKESTHEIKKAPDSSRAL